MSRPVRSFLGKALPSPGPQACGRPFPASRRSFLLATTFTMLFVLLPFLFWHATWFGRRLTDQQIEEYLRDARKPRRAQHALARIAERIARGDPIVKRWYPQVASLAENGTTELRVTAAWVMGQDNHSEPFHQALRQLLEDPEPMVRRNAALALVRFGDAQGRPELLAMLQPYTIHAPCDGILSSPLREDDPVAGGTLVAKIQGEDGKFYDVRSPLPGRVQQKLVSDGTEVSAGMPLLILSPHREHVWEALRALCFVGQLQDLPVITHFAQGIPGMPSKIQRQALVTLGALRSAEARDIRASESQAAPAAQPHP